MYADGPRGDCDAFQLSEETVAAYLLFSGENEQPYLEKNGEGHRYVPPMLVFCRAFSAWLKAFTAVKTPDGGFPGHLQDTWQQHQLVEVGESLTVRHRVGAYRESNSRPGMSLLTIKLEVLSHSGVLVQSGSVLLMMAA